MLSAVVQWGAYFKDVLPEQALGINLVLENECDGPWSYIIYGNQVEFMGQGDLHQQRFDEYKYRNMKTVCTLGVRGHWMFCWKILINDNGCKHPLSGLEKLARL